MPWPGFEPGLSRPQREVLTTIRSRPERLLTWDALLETLFLNPGSWFDYEISSIFYSAHKSIRGCIQSFMWVRQLNIRYSYLYIHTYNLNPIPLMSWGCMETKPALPFPTMRVSFTSGKQYVCYTPYWIITDWLAYGCPVSSVGRASDF